jgi:hypothetical protein
MPGALFAAEHSGSGRRLCGDLPMPASRHENDATSSVTPLPHTRKNAFNRHNADAEE